MTSHNKEIAGLIKTHQTNDGRLLTIGTVESATGGEIADKITNIPGSSDYYKGTIVAYSNEIKTRIVGVKEETINNFGSVSAKAAKEMAEGGRKVLQVDICIADTGIAGPTGATSKKPLGLFYLSLAAENTLICKRHRFYGNRLQNKQQASQIALLILRDYLLKMTANSYKTKNESFDEKHVVTCFLENNNRILILRRSNKVGSYQNHWAGVSGYLERNEIDQAMIEIKEETGLECSDIDMKIQGLPIKIIDNKLRRIWIVHPFLFHVKSPDKIEIDWEHVESKWIKPEALIDFNTVPGLKDALKRVLKIND